VESGASTSPRTYRSDRRNAQSRATRRRVLDAATAVFLERGYAAATIRVIATRAEVSVPTVELLFGKKPRLLKAAIDLAIAGDDDAVGVLDRDWASAAAQAAGVDEVLAIAAGVIGPAQMRSAGLVLAVFEGAPSDAELADLTREMVDQRASTAAWLVDRLVALVPLRGGCTWAEAVDTVWMLMDSVVFDRLTRQRGWTVGAYQCWLADSIKRLLMDDARAPKSTTPSPTRRTI
jgi:AcrR family transcriptional regulator